MINIEINKQEISVLKDKTIIQAIESVGIKIPRFCFHEKLSIAGNCRMCLVEIEKIGKPVASCTLNVIENMQIYTNTILVKKAREAVLELLLINHPLDCPICDQGGECDLQDQTLLFGNDKSRFYEIKRAVSDKNVSPIIKTIMTRCIHCTRCIRFLSDISGNLNFGVTGRGNFMEIGTYKNSLINSEISGNIIDLCPVGALTGKSYSFISRSWELKNYETLDIFDSLGSNIIIQTRGTIILRVLPRINEILNEEWITDKIRFGLDGLLIQRLNFPMYQIKYNLKLCFNNLFLIEKLKLNNFKSKIICSWSLVFKIFKEQLFFKYANLNKYIVLGNQVNLESLNLLKLLYTKFNFNNMLNQYANQLNVNIDFQKNYYINILPKHLENLDVCLLIGINLRLENPLLNVRLRKSFLKNNTIIGSVGPSINSIYNLKKIGNSILDILSILKGKNKFNIYLSSGINPLIILGNYINNLNFKIDYLLSILNNKNLKIVNIYPYINSLSLFELGINYYNYSYNLNNNFYYLMQADEILLNNKNYYLNFIVYQGYQLDRNANYADLIFPSTNFVEENNRMLNIIGKVENLNKISNVLSFKNSDNRNSYIIILNLLNYLLEKRNTKLNYLFNLKIEINNLNNYNNYNIRLKLFNIIINNLLSNFYKTDSITRSSLLMSKIIKSNNKNYLNLNY